MESSIVTGDKLSEQEASHPYSVTHHYRSGQSRWEAEVKCINAPQRSPEALSKGQGGHCHFWSF